MGKRKSWRRWGRKKRVEEQERMTEELLHGQKEVEEEVEEVGEEKVERGRRKG